MAHDALFSPLPLTSTTTLRNRIVMAPMTTWAANEDLTISDDEDAYYRLRVNGVGMVITGCTQVQPNGIGFTHEFSAAADTFLPSLRKLADAAKSGGAKAVLQIFHAGNKALPELVPNRDVVAPSAVAVGATVFAPAQTPRELTAAEIEGVILAFGDATRRAIDAGFDGVELHAAHGFLIQNFLSANHNQRTDKWGGDHDQRCEFLLSVVDEVQRAIAAHADGDFILGVRLSPEESGGYDIDDTLKTIDALITQGISYLHLSLGSALRDRPSASPESMTIVERVVAHVDERVSVIAAGGIRSPEQAALALKMGLSGVAIGQGLVMNPDWVDLAEVGQDADIRESLDPADLDRLKIPQKLWAIIEARPGWFNLQHG